MKQGLLTFLFCLFSINCLTAFNNKLAFQKITALDGLEKGSGAFMTKDAAGYVWISGLSGVYRYNGIQLKKYDAIGGNDQIQSGFIEDKQHNLWFSTYTSVVKYERATDQFISFPIVLNKDTIQTDYRTIYLEQDSILWLTAGNNILKYNVVNEKVRKVASSKAVKFSVQTDAKGKVKQIHGSPWFNEMGFDLFLIKEDGSIIKKEFLKKTDYVISGSLVGTDSLIWLFSNKGLILFNPKSPSDYELFAIPEKRTILTCGVFIEAHKILLGVRDNGIWQFDTKKKRFENKYEFTRENEQSLSSNKPRNIYLDYENHLWVAHHHVTEIDHTWVNNNKFWNPFLGQQKELPTINSIVEDSAHKIWCASFNNGIYVFNSAKKIIAHYPYATTNLAPIKELSIDENGIIWAVGRNTLYQFNNRFKIWEQVLASDNMQFFNLAHLKNNKEFLSTNKGVLEFSKADFKLSKNELVDNQDALNVTRLFSINNTLYTPSKAEKIYAIKFTENHFEEKRAIIFNAEVNTMMEGVNKSIWIGASHGFFKLEKVDNEHQISQIDAPFFSNMQVFGLVTTGSNLIWLTTTQGLFSFNPISNQFRHFDEKDGIPSLDFSLNAQTQLSNGEIWIGTSEGLVIFHPTALQAYPNPPRVGIENMLINNEPLQTEQPILSIDQLNLKYWENSIRLDVVANTSYYPKAANLIYRLHPYDDQWNQVKNNTPIKYFQVPPNEYTLEIYSTNTNGLRGESKFLAINIARPIWEQTWFRILAIILLIGLIYTISKLYARRKLKQQQVLFEKELALRDERNRIASELHDDLGSGLSSIRILSDYAIRQKDKRDIITKNINHIYHAAGDLLDRMRDIIWVLDNEKDSLEKLIDYLEQYTTDFLEINRVDFDFIIASDIPEVSLNGETRRNILLTVKEALHNISKHAKATMVGIHIEIVENDLCMLIKDNGVGIDKNKLNKNGNGLKNMRRRIEATGGIFEIEVVDGTIIRLNIPVIAIKQS